MGLVEINRLDIGRNTKLLPHTWGVLYIKKEEGITLPHDIVPTTGEHDYTTCKTCVDNLKLITERLTLRFEGDKQRKGFPNCCNRHAKLAKVKGFDRKLFKPAIQSTALKIIYTNQHIINHFNDSNWEKTIRDYIVYSINSFGTMPEDCGNPLFIEEYYRSLLDILKDTHDIPEYKRERIVDLVKTIFYTENGDLCEDIDILFKTYDRWQRIFPFELKEYFKDQRSTLHNRIPFFKGEVEVNAFDGKEYALSHTPHSLIEHLCALTNTLLSEVDTHKMVKDGMIADINAHQFEIAGVTLRLQNELNLKKYAQNERAYAETIRQWLADQQGYFTAITPLLNVNAHGKEAQEEERSFEDHLLGSKEAKEALMLKLKPLLKGAKGKRAATVLLALRELKLIGIPEHGKQKLYKAINHRFGLSLRNESYQRYIQFDNKGIVVNVITEAEIEDIVKILK